MANNKDYDGNTAASLYGGALSGLVAGESLGLAGQTAIFADKNAANGKTVTVTGTTLVDTATGLASNYTVSNPSGLTASITQAALGVQVDNAEKDQGRANPAFTAKYTGLLGGDTLANEVSGNLAFSTPATTGTPSGSYLVSAAGQTSTNYALTYTPGVLTVKPTEALQSAVASVIAAVNVAPSQGNMVQADVVAKGETVTSKEDAVQVAVEGVLPQQGSTPVVQTTASVNSNVLPGLRLNVIDTGLRLPMDAGNTSIESQ